MFLIFCCPHKFIRISHFFLWYFSIPTLSIFLGWKINRKVSIESIFTVHKCEHSTCVKAGGSTIPRFKLSCTNWRYRGFLQLPRESERLVTSLCAEHDGCARFVRVSSCLRCLRVEITRHVAVFHPCNSRQRLNHLSPRPLRLEVFFRLRGPKAKLLNQSVKAQAHHRLISTRVSILRTHGQFI